MVAPRSIHTDPADVPEIENEHALIRIIHGTYISQTTPYQMVTAADLFHVYLQPKRVIRIAAREMAFVYGLQGRGTSGGKMINSRTLINYSLKGDNIVVNADNDGLEFMFGSGTPMNEPVIYGGPFVATTPEQMAEFQRRYTAGKMGQLDLFDETTVGYNL